MVSTAVEDMPEKAQKFGFDIILKKKVQTYIEVESSGSPEFLGEQNPNHQGAPSSPWCSPDILPYLFPDEKKSKPDLLAPGEGSALFRHPEWILHLPAVPGQPAVHQPRDPALREDVRSWLCQHGWAQHHQGSNLVARHTN